MDLMDEAFGPWAGPVDFDRQPSGRYAPANVEEDESVAPDRNPQNGEFVSPNRGNAGLDRDTNNGRFRWRPGWF